jgi:hypothetical protein
MSGALVLATAVSADQDLQNDLNSTNRVSVSLRYGLNITGKFHGPPSANFPMGSLSPSFRRTPNGDLYNYLNGYVLTDISGDAGHQTWYWGYDSSSQVNLVDNTISFYRDRMAGLPTMGDNSMDDSSRLGVELAYSYEIGTKEDWHHLRYGVELAINWTPVTLDNNGGYGITRLLQTDTYSYTPGTTPPGYGVPSELPYEGTFQGPNFVINVPAVSSVSSALPSADFLVQQHFDANLWGIRLGPYIELPLSKRWSVHVGGGLAVGLLSGNASWHETLSIPGVGSVTQSGGGNDTAFLWGGYIGAQAQYQINERWGLEAGAQYQYLGLYNHNFGGCAVQLDLRKAVFLHAGVSFSF